MVLLGAAIGGVRALTAIFAKIGLEGVDSDFATLIRTVVILCAIAWFVHYTGKWRGSFVAQFEELEFYHLVRLGYRRVVGLLFSRLADGRGGEGRTRG